jgi:hypothetical protein
MLRSIRANFLKTPATALLAPHSTTPPPQNQKKAHRHGLRAAAEARLPPAHVAGDQLHHRVRAHRPNGALRPGVYLRRPCRHRVGLVRARRAGPWSMEPAGWLGVLCVCVCFAKRATREQRALQIPAPSRPFPSAPHNRPICVTFTMAIAAALAELCSAYPAAGGVYYWSWAVAPRKSRGLWAWITLWLNLTGLVSKAA